MNPVDSLIAEHIRLRAALSEMEAEFSAVLELPRQLQEAPLQRLRSLRAAFAAALKAHEEAECCLLVQALNALESGGSAPIEALLSEHEEIHEIFSIIYSLLRVEGEEDLYAVGFVLSRLVRLVRSHMALEERWVFPEIRKVLDAERRVPGG